MRNDGFACQVRTRGDTVAVAVSGELDMATGPVLSAAVRGRLRPGAQVVLVCSQTTFPDVAGLSALVELRANARAAGAGFGLAGASDAVRRVLELSGPAVPFLPVPGCKDTEASLSPHTQSNTPPTCARSRRPAQLLDDRRGVRGSGRAAGVNWALRALVASPAGACRGDLRRVGCRPRRRPTGPG